MNTRPLQIAVLQILDAAIGQLDHGQPLYGDWSVQGMGMLRLYVRKIGRIHIWDSALRYPGVSMLHNHSWDLRSTVVCGSLVNTRYEEFPLGTPTHIRRTLVTGYNCEFVKPEEQVKLISGPREIYVAGDVYRQTARIIHRTDAEDSTITVMERNEDTNGEADVLWPVGTAWGTAKPRRATNNEIEAVVGRAIKKLEECIGIGQ